MVIETIWAVLENISWLWGKRKKTALLIIDDNADDAEILGNSLKRLGYQYSVETTAESGLSVLKRERHWIVYVDIRLPLMSGIKFIDAIKTISPKTHVVIVAGLSGDLAQLTSNHYIGVIIKPPTLESVQDSIQKTKR